MSEQEGLTPDEVREYLNELEKDDKSKGWYKRRKRTRGFRKWAEENSHVFERLE